MRKTGRYTLRVCSQGAGTMRDLLAAIMGIEKQALHVITEDVGGAFGLKTGAYPEYPALLVGRQKARPQGALDVEPLGSLQQRQPGARQCHRSANSRSTSNGKFLALRARQVQNLGAYVAFAGIQLATNNFARCFPAMYDIPKLDIAVQCVYTNTLPTGPYRGAGRPEANYAIERLVEEAARVTGIDARGRCESAISFRPRAMPYKTAIGAVFDSGEFRGNLRQGAGARRYRRLQAAQARLGGERQAARASAFPASSNIPAACRTRAPISPFPARTRWSSIWASQNTGQGHATVYPRLVAEKLGIDVSHVKHRHGDSDLEIKGGPSVASRSTITAGTAVVRTIEAMLEKGRKLAAHVLEADEKDIAYRRGLFEVVGTDRSIGLFELAAKAAEMKDKGEIEENLDTKRDFDTPQTFPNGCHIAEVEVTPETGEVDVVGYYAVDDCGVMLDHTLVHGQVQGGIAQGARTGAAGKRGLRFRQRPARHRLVHGLRDAARASHAVAAARRFPSGAGDHQSARRQGRRRSRHHRFARRDHECDRGRGAGCGTHGHAGDAGEGLAGV